MLNCLKIWSLFFNLSFKCFISGILSFFAIQAGARKVYAVEASSMASHAEVCTFTTVWYLNLCRWFKDTGILTFTRQGNYRMCYWMLCTLKSIWNVAVRQISLPASPHGLVTGKFAAFDVFFSYTLYCFWNSSKEWSYTQHYIRKEEQTFQNWSKTRLSDSAPKGTIQSKDTSREKKSNPGKSMFLRNWILPLRPNRFLVEIVHFTLGLCFLDPNYFTPIQVMVEGGIYGKNL